MRKMMMAAAALTLLTMVQAVAQEPFSVKTLPFHRYVKLTSNDVNLRRSCSTSSPRLIVEQSYGEKIYFWENGKLGPGERPAHAKVLPVWEPYFMKGLRVADGWLCGHFQDKMVFVMEKYCQETTLRPLSRNEKLDFDELILIGKGKYKDYFLSQWYESDGDGEYCVISIGKYVNGVYIVNYSVRDVPASIGELASDEKKLDAFVSQYCKIDNYKPVFYFAVEGVKGWHRIFGIG